MKAEDRNRLIKDLRKITVAIADVMFILEQEQEEERKEKELEISKE